MSETKTKKTSVKETTETTEPVKKPEPKSPKKVYKNGVVANCQKLNIRKEPKDKAEIIDIFDQGTKVLVDENESTTEWCKISTKTGVEGFCVSRYIEIKS